MLHGFYSPVYVPSVDGLRDKSCTTSEVLLKHHLPSPPPPPHPFSAKPLAENNEAIGHRFCENPPLPPLPTVFPVRQAKCE